MADPIAKLDERDSWTWRKVERELALVNLLREEVNRLTVAYVEKKIEPQPRNVLYGAVLLVILFVVGLLVWTGWANNPDVSIDFDVGEIIGGVLVGIGAMIAGLAYARRQGLFE